MSTYLRLSPGLRLRFAPAIHEKSKKNFVWYKTIKSVENFPNLTAGIFLGKIPKSEEKQTILYQKYIHNN